MYEIQVPSEREPEKPEAPVLSFFSSFGSKLSATAQAYAPAIKTSVSATLEKAEALVQREKEAFVLEQKKTSVLTPQALEAQESAEVLPWSNLSAHQMEQLKKQVLLLSHEKWNFLAPLNRDAPTPFEPYMVGQAKALLEIDSQLQQMRFALVPTKIKEEPFWANYFGRVKFLKSTVTQPAADRIPPALPTEVIDISSHSPPAAGVAVMPSSASPTVNSSSPIPPAALARTASPAKAPSPSINTATTPAPSTFVSVSGLNAARPIGIPAQPRHTGVKPFASSSSPISSSSLSSYAAPSATTACTFKPSATYTTDVPLVAPNDMLAIDPTFVPLAGLSPAALASASSPSAPSVVPPPAPVSAFSSPPTPPALPVAVHLLPPTHEEKDLLTFSDVDPLELETEDALGSGAGSEEVALVDIDELELSIDAILGLGNPKPAAK